MKKERKLTTLELYKQINNLIIGEGAAICLGDLDRFKKIHANRKAYESEFNKRRNKSYVLRQIAYENEIREERRLFREERYGKK